MQDPDIKLICEWCVTTYFVRYCQDKKVIAWRLDFAVCPDCRIPHNIPFYVQYRKNWRCHDCGVPEPFVVKKTQSQCASCYIFTYRGGKVTTKPNLVRFS
jgi:hypothetical protein